MEAQYKSEKEKQSAEGILNLIRVVKRYLPYCSGLWPKFFLILVLTPIVVTVIYSVIPLFSVLFYDDAVPRNSFQKMFIMLAAIFCANLLFQVNFLLESFVRYDIKMRLLREVGSRFYDHLLKLSLGYHNSRPVGERIFRSFIDVHDGARGIAVSLPNAISTCIQGIFVAVVTAMIDWRTVVVLILFMPPYFIFSHYVVTKWRYNDRLVREKRQDVTSHLQQTLAAPHVVKASTQERAERNRYVRKLSSFLRAFFQWNMFGGLNEGYIHPAGLASAFSILTSSLWGYFYITDVITLGQWTALQLLINNVLIPSSNVVLNFQGLRREMVAAERVLEVLDIEPNVPEIENPICLDNISGGVEFQNVKFEYLEGNPVLKDVSFKIEPGSVVAFVGPSGSGKSTILNLILRFYDPETGKVLLDGEDVKHLSTDFYRRRIGVVLQRPQLFAGTVRENITYGCSVVEEKAIQKALDLADCSKFVEDLPLGMDTIMAEGGDLSGGQKRRLTIARALVRDPQLLLLDEPLASIDVDSELKIGKALKDVSEGRTVIYATHNLLSIQDVDKIFVMDQGKIIESGTHKELLDMGGFYNNMFVSGMGRPEQT